MTYTQIIGGFFMSPKIKNIIISVGMAVLLLSGCSAIGDKLSPPATSNGSSGDRGVVGGIAPDQAQKPGYSLPPVSQSGPITGEQKLIKNGNLTLKAKNIDTAQQEIDIIAKRYNGYIFSMRQSQTPEKRYLTITIKVQKERFDDAVNDIKQLGQTSNIEMDVTDVTTQFIDTEARIKTLKVKETTLMTLLGKATQISDIIVIEESLQQTRQQIESNEGQLNALKNATDYSIITINVTDEEGLLITEQSESLWVRFTTNFNNGLRYWARVGVDVVSGAIFLIPILIPLAIILFLIARFNRKNKLKLLQKYDPVNKSKLYARSESPIDTRPIKAETPMDDHPEPDTKK